MTDADDPLVGRVLLGKLEVVRRLGAGGMGAVYEVIHRLTHHHRALKVLHSELARDADVVARFLREASVAGTLQSPHVVETFDAGQLEDGSPYVLMELLEGSPLTDLIAGGAVTPARTVRIVLEACEGLQAAHTAGIVHRDIKPDNLFLTIGSGGAERIKLLDFGISKFARPAEDDVRLTQTGLVLGTPLYMSPEQASADADLDERTDIYSLGVILYELLSGGRPSLRRVFLIWSFKSTPATTCRSRPWYRTSIRTFAPWSRGRCIEIGTSVSPTCARWPRRSSPSPAVDPRRWLLRAR